MYIFNDAVCSYQSLKLYIYMVISECFVERLQTGNRVV